MSYIQQLLSYIKGEVVRTVKYYHTPPRIGLVSSYNKQLHAVKVLLQPEGTESGWIPLSTMAVGNQFGILSAPNIRDQVVIHSQGGDSQVAIVASRLFSKLDQPPQVDPGEHLIVHQSGSGQYHKADGTVQFFGPKFMQTGQPQSGQSGTTSTGGQSGDTGQSVPQQQQTQANGKQVWQYNPDGSSSYTVPNGPHTTTVQGNISITSQTGTHTITAQNDITQTSQNGKHNSTASQGIFHNGADVHDQLNHFVGLNLNVTQIGTALAWNQQSDRRAKDNFGKLTYVLERALKLPVYTFDVWPSKIEDGEVKHIGEPLSTFGLIAQEVREHFPQIIDGNEATEILRLHESKIGVIALAALQEYVAKADAKIIALEQRIAELENH